jgi:phosphatidylinositol phospholipase C delta
MNQAMFQRNGRSGYLLKPAALREGGEKLLSKHTNHVLDITVSLFLMYRSACWLIRFACGEQIISAQQLPLPKNSRGEEKVEKSVVDPFVQVSIHIPDWIHAPLLQSSDDAPPTLTPAAMEARTISASSKVVNDNGFNPVWQEKLSLPFDCVGDMRELVFVHFAVRQDGDTEDDEPLAIYCTPLSCLESGMFILP